MAVARSQGGSQPQALFQQAVLLFQQGRHGDAERLLTQVLQRLPNHPAALHLLATIALDSGRAQRALLLLGKAIKLLPNAAALHDSLANALSDLGRREEALAHCDKAIALDPRFADAHVNRGNILNALKRHAEAVASYDRALAIAPDFVEAHFNRGIALGHLRRNEDSLACCDTVIALRPDFAEAHFNRGNVLHELGRDDEALDSFATAIALRPDHAEAHFNIGNILRLMRRHAEAVTAYDHAIALKPDHADAYHNRGIALYFLGLYAEALASHEKTLLLKPDYEYLHGDMIQFRLNMCDWTGLEQKIEQLARKIEAGDVAGEPFTALLTLRSPSLQRKCAEIFTSHKFPPSRALPPIVKHKRHEKIRLGYFSADFRDHPVSTLMVELFENHDRSRFHLVGFAFGAVVNDEMTQRVSKSFDEFVDLRGVSDLAAARLARELEIDIAIDLGGFTLESRTAIFAARAAPIQVNYIGYLGTMGVDYIDYIIADKVIIPDGEQKYYAEKVARLPSFQSNSIVKQVSGEPLARSHVGLPEKAFIYCCFNNNFKITPDVFRIWIGILMAVPDSVLWLYVTNDLAIANLRRTAVELGLSGERLVFAKRVPTPEYLARLRLADLFLDTLPYNAGTTASDALWMGLPVLTRSDTTFASRVGASLLTAIGLPELITPNAGEYAAMAIGLARYPEHLAGIRRRLAANRLTTALFDTRRFAKTIEAAYIAMYERHQADLPPDHIDIA